MVRILWQIKLSNKIVFKNIQILDIIALKYLFCIILSIQFLACNSSPSNSENPADQSNNQTFNFVLYDGLSNSIIQNIQKKLNDNIKRVLSDLGVDSVAVTTIKIWNDESHFLDDMQKDIGIKYYGATGYIYSKKEIRMLYRGDAPQIALHEFCHIVSIYVNPTISNNPRWLWEAVAIYEAGEFIHPRNISYLVQDNFPTIAELNNDYNSGNQKIYQVGYLLSEFIIETYGANKFIQLIKSNGNIQSILNISDAEFENNWKSFIKIKYLK